MRNDVLQMIFALLVLVIGTGCEELLPKFCGMGFPVLLTSVQIMTVRMNFVVAVIFAIAAGTMEDAISALPPMTSVSYFLIVAALVKWVGYPRGMAAFTYVGYQLCLAVWLGGINVFTRILLAFPIGLITAFVVAGLLSWSIRKAAIDERG